MVVIDREVLRKVIERAGGKEVIRNRYKSVDDWLSGKKFPTFKQLEYLAQKSGIPIGDIILGKIPEPLEGLEITFFRRNPEVPPSIELERLVRLTKSRVEFASEYLEELGYSPCEFVGSITTEEDVEEVASYIREVIKLDKDWIEKNEIKTKKDAFRFLREKLEESRIFVFCNSHFENNTHLKLNPEEFKGFSIVDKYAPAIFVNTTAYLSTQIFTLMHELVHIFLGNSAISQIDEVTLDVADVEVEKFCNKVAAALLVPSEKLEGEPLSYERLEKLGEELKISTLVVILRAFERKLIRKKEYFDYLTVYKKKFFEHLEKSSDEEEKKRKGGGDWYRTKINQLSYKFLQLAIEAFHTRSIPPNHFVFLTGVKVSNIQKIEERIR
jgi:Zn-dependent peptidase ImmA (M78 family)